MIPSDEDLANISYEFDEFVTTSCFKYKMSPLALSGLVLARLTKFAKEIGYLDEHEKLLMAVVNRIYEDSQTITKSDQLH